MSTKGIVIDVGFAADIQDFIGNIDKQFKKINFDNMLGLSKAFDSQIQDIKGQLKGLKKEIDLTLNESYNIDPNKQMQTISNAVNTLTLSLKEMANSMPTSQASKLTIGLDGVISDMNELSNVCGNAASAVKKVSEVAGGDVKFVNKSQINDLKEVYSILGSAIKESDNFDKKFTSYSKISEVINEIGSSYQRLREIDGKLLDVEESSMSNNQKIIQMDKLNAEYLRLCTTLQRLFATYDQLGGRDYNVKINKISLESISNNVNAEFNRVLETVEKRKTEISSELSNLNTSSSNTSKVVGNINRITEKSKITVPMDISTKSSTLVNRALEIIKQVQSKVEGEPLKVQVAFVSQWKTKQNTESLQQISKSLSNIPDGEIKNKISNLVNDLNKQVGNELHLKVEVKGSENVRASVRQLLSDLKTQINDANLTVRPNIELTEEARTKLQKTIDSLSKGVTVNIGIQNESNDKNGKASNNQIASVIKLKSSLEKVTQAINDKTLAFKVEERTVNGVINREINSLMELSNWLAVIERDIKSISSAVVNLSNFKIVFNKDDLQGIQSLKNISSLSSVLNNGKPSKIPVNLDTTNFDKKITTVKNNLNSIPNKKDISINIKTDKSFNGKDIINKIEQPIKNGQNAVSNAVAAEAQSLNTLTQKLKEVEKAVKSKTEAFKEEQRVVESVAKNEIDALSPLKNLESAHTKFKKFYDTNNLDSEAGAQAALSYYSAYKEALMSKVNKKELQQYTIGKTSDLFTGNYSNYKKGIGNLDLSGLNSKITEYQEIINKFNQPEAISVINSLTEAIKNLLATGNTSAETTDLLKSLNTAINNLGGKNSAEKIEKVVKNLENLQKSVQVLDVSDNGFVKSLSSILEKGEELKNLSQVLKSTKKQMDDTGKAVKAEENLSKAQVSLEKYENSIREAVNKKHAGKNENVLYQQLQATKEGLIQVVALIKDAENKYKQFVYTTTNGSDLKIKATNDNGAVLSKQIKQWEAYEKLKSLAVPGAANLGKEGVSFTPDSDNWDKLVSKAKEFGIEVGNIQKIVRNVDQVGNESFQIFTKLSRITVGVNSNGVLFQKDEVLDANKAIRDFENNVGNLKKSLEDSFKNDMGTDRFLKTLDNIIGDYHELILLKEKGLIDNSTFSSAQNYFNTFRESISSFSLDKISTVGKTPQFIEQLNVAKEQLNLVKASLDKVNTGKPFTDEDIAQIKIFITHMRTLYDTVGDKGNKLGNEAAKQNILGKISDVLSKNTNMSDELRQKFMNLSKEMIAFGNNLPADKLQEFGTRFKTLEAEMKQSGQTGLSFFDGVIKRAKSMSRSFISMYLSLWSFIRYIRKGLTYIKEMDTALTEMRKVSDETVKTLKEFQNTSFDIAKSVGTTAKQIQESTADWMRLGESIEEAAKSAKVANILLNVSEFESIDEATESLVSMSAAYGHLEKIEIVDKLNQVGNNFAISTDGLATALQSSASALKTAKNDIDESIALATAANAVVQDPDKVGTGLRTISLRITGTEAAKEELAELGEDVDDFVVTTSSKLNDKVKALTKTVGKDGISLLDDNGNYRSTYEILQDIADVWEQIAEEDLATGQNRQNALLEMLAGDRICQKFVETHFNRTHLIARTA